MKRLLKTGHSAIVMRIIFALCLILTAFSIIPAGAQEEKTAPPPPKADFSPLTMTTVEQVADVIDPLRLRLQNGTIVHLAGLDIPDLTPYDSGEIGMATLVFLRDALLHKPVRVYQDKSVKNRVNRMGYAVAHLESRDGDAWVQGMILANGLARVRPSASGTDMAMQMMMLEGEARAEKRGLWADERYAVLTPETAGEAMNGWAIVEGTVRASAMAGNTVYLNFGPDWKTDFTIGLPPDVRRAMTNAGINPLGFAGKTIRARGWIERYNGPYMEMLDPIWIEILQDTPERPMVAPDGN